MKNFFRNIHLYLSLAAGLVIIFSAVTGAIMVFEEEIEHAIYKDRFYVQPSGSSQALDTLIKNALDAVPKSKIATVKVYQEANRTVEIALMVPEKKEETKDKAKSKISEAIAQSPAKDNKSQKVEKGKKGGKPSIIVYIDPYTGSIKEVFNRKESFFMKVEMLHRFILGGQDGIGKWITGISTLFFFFILITGLILWWPRTKAILFQRLKIKTDGSFKRLNHDLHIVTGFYTSIFLIVVVMTGLIMAFNWLNKGLFILTNSSSENPEAPISEFIATGPVSAQVIYTNIKQKVPNSEFYNIRVPKDSSATFAVNVLPVGDTENRSGTYYLDQYSGNVVGNSSFADKNLGQKIRSYVKPVHTGEIYGITTKIINFILCLLTITFPITGVIMWLNRLKKEKKRKRKTRLVA